jgi:hypothetical protein
MSTVVFWIITCTLLGGYKPSAQKLEVIYFSEMLVTAYVTPRKPQSSVFAAMGVSVL